MAAVGCIQAGVDIVLGPQNLVQAFDAVMPFQGLSFAYWTETFRVLLLNEELFSRNCRRKERNCCRQNNALR